MQNTIAAYLSLLIMTSVYFHIGKYFLLMVSTFTKPEKRKIYWKLIIQEIDKIGLQSLGIVALLSLFMGAVVTLQTAANIDSGWIPRWTIGYTTRQTMILEFSSTIVCLILSGKVGGNIASEIGTMRITEQIDAMEIMGINSASYLILPKIVAALFIFGYTAGVISLNDFEYGLQYDFEMWQVSYSVIKVFFFAFIITSVSAFHGFYTSGGPREVGASSTRAVVYSMVLILVTNYILTQLLLL